MKNRTKASIFILFIVTLTITLIFDIFSHQSDSALQHSLTVNLIRASDIRLNSDWYCKPSHDRFAIFTIISSPDSNYVTSACTLIKSIIIYGNIDFCTVELNALVIDTVNQLPEFTQSRSKLINNGWTITQVPQINLPDKAIPGVYDARFLPLMTKLHIFNDTRYNSSLFLDADILVLGDLMPLFHIFAPMMQRERLNLAWVHDQPYTIYPGFNAGMLLVIPNKTLFANLLDARETIQFNPIEAEQSYLNVYFHKKALELPDLYNYNAVILTQNLSRWSKTRIHDIKIFHMTVAKPFWNFGTKDCFVNNNLFFCSIWKQLNRIHATPNLLSLSYTASLTSEEEPASSSLSLSDFYSPP